MLKIGKVSRFLVDLSGWFSNERKTKFTKIFCHFSLFSCCRNLSKHGVNKYIESQPCILGLIPIKFAYWNFLLNDSSNLFNRTDALKLKLAWNICNNWNMYTLKVAMYIKVHYGEICNTLSAIHYIFIWYTRSKITFSTWLIL